MEKKEIKMHIDAIINETFRILKEVYKHQKEPKNDLTEEDKQSHNSHVGSRIIFPRYSKKYRNGETRLSEQELRFIFVEQFNAYCTSHPELHWFYSVETPTEYKYVFSENGEKEIKPQKVEEGEGGQSAMFDLVIHDKYFDRIALIEFKALNPDTSCFAKDFLKLREEGSEIVKYFVMYIKSYQRSDDPAHDTIISLNGKIEQQKDTNEKLYKQETEFRCFVVDPYKKYPETRIEKMIEHLNS